MDKILVIGSTCLDMIVNINHIPNRCEDVNSNSVEFSLGGMAYNVYNILSLLKVPSIFGCGIGEGSFASIVEKMLEEKGYEPIGKIKDIDNGICICLVDKTNERSFIAQHGAEYLFDPKWYKDINMQDIDMIYISGLEIEDKNGKDIIKFLEDNHLENRLFFATSSRIKEIPEVLLNRIYKLRPIIHLNEDELKMLTNEANVDKALSLLYNKTQNIIILTLGSKGSMIYDGKDKYEQKITKQVKVIDTIGAGDCHAGACLAGLYHNLAYDDILKIANKIGANIVAHKGSNATKEDIKGINL